MEKEVKILSRVVDIARSKKTGKLFLYCKSNGKNLFVNLIKDHKAFRPEIEETAKKYAVEYTGSKEEPDTNRIALFDVRNFTKVE